MNELTINILVILVLSMVLGLFWYMGKKNVVKAIILDLVMNAEERWGSGMGKVKLTAVIALAYQRFPLIVKLFVTESIIIKWIEEAVAYIKTVLVSDPETGDPITLEKKLSGN